MREYGLYGCFLLGLIVLIIWLGQADSDKTEKDFNYTTAFEDGNVQEHTNALVLPTNSAR